jgi:hypothetical protein
MAASITSHPMRAAASAASHPACPAPTTITSYFFVLGFNCICLYDKIEILWLHLKSDFQGILFRTDGQPRRLRISFL